MSSPDVLEMLKKDLKDFPFLGFAFKDTDFDSGGSLLSSTMNRLTALTKKGHHRVMLYLILFCLLVFFVTWYIIKRR